jgi:hypothetical protein
MKEQFVTYEIALKLKELGFNEECLCGWEIGYQNIPYLHSPHNKNTFGIPNFKKYCHSNKHIIQAPLWQQVIDWLREEYNINIKFEPTTQDKHDIFINFNIGWEFYKALPYYEAREQAILKAIELINEKEKTK